MAWVRFVWRASRAWMWMWDEGERVMDWAGSVRNWRLRDSRSVSLGMEEKADRGGNARP